jgi:ribosome-associated protein
MTMGELTGLEKLRLIAEAALDRKAEDLVALDVRALTSFADTFIVLSGRSDRQVRSIADHISQSLKAAGDPPIGIEGLDEGHWVLLDCNDVIIHAFEPETRDRFALERLWHDAPRIELGIGADGASEASQAGDALGAELGAHGTQEGRVSLEPVEEKAAQ